MSADSVDDLHAAEDEWGSAVATAKECLRLIAEVDPADPAKTLFAVQTRLEVVARSLDGYCRPTCQAADDPDNDCPEGDCCGCPCGHADT